MIKYIRFIVMDKNLKAGSNKSFGLVFFVVFILISFYPVLNGENFRLWALAISIIFLILGLLNSKILNPLNHAWFKLGILLGKFFSPLIMALVFFLVVTPIGLLMRLFGKDVLNLKFNNSKTYWIEKKSERINLKDQF